MAYDVEIQIYGLVRDPEKIDELASAIVSEGRVEYFQEIDLFDVLGMLQKAEGAGRPIELTHGRTTDLFDEVRGACQAAGLAYVMKHGASGAEDFDGGRYWRPGMASEYLFLLREGKPVISLALVSAAAERGIESVQALVEKIRSASDVGKIEIEPGFVEAYLKDDENDLSPTLWNPSS